MHPEPHPFPIMPISRSVRPAVQVCPLFRALLATLLFQ